MQDRKVWFIRVTDKEGKAGIGEVAPINRLSPESIDDIPDKLRELERELEKLELPGSEEEAFQMVNELIPLTWPSVRFGLEMALLDALNGGNKKIFRNDLGNISVPINGLIWMGNLDFMKEQIKEKLDQEFTCIKLKIGSLDFESELQVIKELRDVSEDLIIRLDANGAFQTNEVLARLKALNQFNIHSIEQPILPTQLEAMELICAKSEIPIALDEELIHVFSSRDRLSLIQDIKPQYLVLKPTLHGGFASVQEWIDLAEMHGIGWWITSYLESNLGLNAIAQFTSRYESKQHHGLGTGGLYSNNIISPIIINHGIFTYAQSSVWGEIDF